MSLPTGERRRRRVFTTRNTEYHLFDRLCVAVRDISTNTWFTTHGALNRRADGAVARRRSGQPVPRVRLPEVGEGLFFVLGDVENGRQLVTSPVRSVSRPRMADLHRYPAF